MALLAGTLALTAAPAVAQDDWDRSVLPVPMTEFGGHIALRTSDSSLDFPRQVSAPEGAPNVLLIMPDDVGFGAPTAFGGPVPTEAYDRLAEDGLLFTRMHTTALCSPTRSALISGRNHHSNSTGVIMELGTGFPGYNSLMPKENGTIAEILKGNGYNTAWYGKNHNVPDWQSSQAGPFDLWPTGLGFEQFFGFIGGDTSQFTPAIFDGTKPIEPPNTDDYHLDEDMADRAINYIREQHALAPEKPFFVYYAPGTSHAPHHAPQEWIDRFKGQFDQGWDAVREESFARQKERGIIPQDAVLTPRPEQLRAWDSLNDQQKELYARMMEVYAGALSHMDYQINRIIDAVEETGELDNTLIIYLMGDNGASAEGSPDGLLNEMTFFNNIPVPFEDTYARIDELGGPNTFGHFPSAWAHAMNTPFQWTKQVASHFGGTRNGMIIRWPAGIEARGEVRDQFHHVIDIMPTILEAAGLPAPTSINGVAQSEIEGTSMMYAFDNAEAPSTRRTQYFEMLGNRAIYSDGWMATTTPPEAPWVSVVKPTDVITEWDWELYNVAEDFTQANNLAAENPEKLAELQLLFYGEAAKYDVLPIVSSKVERMDVSLRPSLTAGRTEFTYYDNMTRIPEGTAPDFKNKSHTITAHIEIADGDNDGMLVTQGGRFGGWALYVLDGKPVYTYNVANLERYNIEGDPLSAGKHTIRYEFEYDGGGVGKGGMGKLFVNDELVGEGRVERTMGFRISLDETFDIGSDAGEPVSESYHVPFDFPGTLEKVEVKLR
ncbi:sulfatase-like hydrolase/transferase [Ruegeria sp. HKCCD5849]|nr:MULTISPECIES: arylsulfatase [unclassified Ruegeria]NOD48492.1 sulfatase-like hydrolase/transferase [Ruegeria sp. HKCCD5849]NOD52512.1 sulfatase-like hydrolase/transferase [Ruegeria sp. HKCCD5851]NOD68615.1 sulfatase-like hydrolase/transferase [Ruegeria sp. HKCCD7303]NOE36291.1 sulfatase-like hydrolase/transferase [Ruegeria sp. HKCCD7318]